MSGRRSGPRPPRDAATLILLDRSGSEPKVLLGRRHEAHAFMPGKFVFPGGRVEPSDRWMSAAGALPPGVEEKLRKRVARPSGTRARALALAAIRETFEEAGLLVGRANGWELERAPPGPWAEFVRCGVIPSFDGFHFIARAITPPGRPRRFDAAFFAVDAKRIAHRLDGRVGPQAELVELAWVAIGQARELDLPTITRLVLAELESRIARGMDHGLPVPFFRERYGRHVREEL
jgi:8-oxo-dGTP pyrophosphatase MutT (NUDIX family)